MRKFWSVPVVLISLGSLLVVIWLRSHAATPEPWFVDAREQLVLEGINARYRTAIEALAPVCSDVAARQAIVQYLAPRLQALGEAEKETLASVRARLRLPSDVALVASGGEWVRRP